MKKEKKHITSNTKMGAPASLNQLIYINTFIALFLPTVHIHAELKGD
jgi:hypothetical protein